MERGSVAAKARPRSGSTEARVDRGYEILLDDSDEDGLDYARPTASMVLETDCPILGNPVIQLSGEPEVLTNGDDLLGYYLFGDVVKDRS
jgi:hypothetical protein